ncbi:MAG: Type 4 fimbrial assembly protein pilC [Parcubacteria group bacterium GW2011_GWA1_59_11]|nr:MAG: Type 4 fimbrial assembly protein pilC [Parcubacteria group bacterium GW2011_GWA1_59_11]
MLYHYLAADNEGKIVEAELDADNLTQVLQFLAGKELRPVAVKPVKQKISGLKIMAGKVNLSDKVFLTKYLSLMLKVGTDLLSAINILIADTDNPAVKNLLLEVRENLTKGRPFYEAFERYPKIFDPVFVHLVKAAEASGNLQQTFENLSTSLQKEAELRGRVRSALIYPVILLCTSLLVFIFLVTFALPKIAKVFMGSGLNPPTFSRIVFAVGLFVNDNIIALGIGFLLVVGPGIWFFWKTRLGHRILSRLAGRLPLVNKIYRDLAVQRFAATFSALMRAGLPIMQATKLTSEVVGSEKFRFSLIRIADEGLAKGLTIGEAFHRETVFPRVVSNLVAISEKAGHLEEVLETLSEFYASSVDSNIRMLVSFLEPALLLTMGIMVASIALAIIVPIYQLTNQF